jgi:hypothetical protein
MTNQSENKKQLFSYFDCVSEQFNDEENVKMVELLKQLIIQWNLSEKDFKIVQKKWINAYRKIYVNKDRYQKVVEMIYEIGNVYKKEVVA